MKSFYCELVPDCRAHCDNFHTNDIAHASFLFVKDLSGEATLGMNIQVAFLT